MFLSEHGFDMFSLLPIPILLAICSIVPVILAALKIKKVPAFTIHIIIGMLLGSFAKSKNLFDTPLTEGIYTVGLGFFLLLSGLDTDYSVVFKRKEKNDINVNVFKTSWILMGSVILVSLALTLAFLFIFPIETTQFRQKIEIILLITILFSSTFASVVIPIIHERSFAKTTVGQIICTYATIAELFSIISLSLLMIFDKIKHNQEPWLLAVAFGILIIVYIIKCKVNGFFVFGAEVSGDNFVFCWLWIYATRYRILHLLNMITPIRTVISTAILWRLFVSLFWRFYHKFRYQTRARTCLSRGN